jgi:aspartate aminotransferase-like enzyme
MQCRGCYEFKAASTEAEIEQIHRLNHETFVDEVGQCRATPDGRLIDKFHDKNTYFVAKRGDEVVGMVAVHDRPPFSIADRLADPEALARLGDRPLEVRLLIVRRDVRRGMVLPGLILAIRDHARLRESTHLLISGLRQRVPLYEKLGYRAMGPAVPCGSAEFVPMSLDFRRPPAASLRMLERWRAHLGRSPEPNPSRTISLLPGPVEIAEDVRSALATPPRSHRSEAFIDQFERARERLGVLVGRARGEVAIVSGSGTLANDVVASALRGDPGLGPGLILANGEFGERLARQVDRFDLEARVLRSAWGRPWDLAAVSDTLASDRAIGWVWVVHLESSTGMLNDLEGLVEAARRAGVRVCADCVSSLGATEIDLAGVHLASGSSGKSLGSFGGLGFVFASPEFLGRRSDARTPTYLDLREALATRGPRFTISSPLVDALDRALDDFATPDRRRARYDHSAELGRRVRRGLAGLGLRPLVDEPWASPVLTTFAPPEGWSADEFRAACLALGFEVAGESDYLKARGWLQIATMGAVTLPDCDALFRGLADRLATRRK